jgi:hypothetical protein
VCKRIDLGTMLHCLDETERAASDTTKGVIAATAEQFARPLESLQWPGQAKAFLNDL